MVKLTRIYTRGGDQGQTSLGDGTRVDKDDPRVAAFGTVDEANACIGLARLHSQGNNDAEIDAMLMRMQNDLFDLGADLCTPESDQPPKHEELRILARQVERLEREIDAMNGQLEPLNSFILPGGSPRAAALHLARTVARRAEREMVALARVERVNPEAVKYINRVSDHLFVLARYANQRGKADILWVPGQTRGD
jgi:cob(I)alamin adenosyltransferase